MKLKKQISFYSWLIAFIISLPIIWLLASLDHSGISVSLFSLTFIVFITSFNVGHRLNDKLYLVISKKRIKNGSGH